VKIFIKRSIYLGVLAVIFSGIISCEKDFTDIGSSVINNSQFDTKDTILEVDITSLPITSVRADGLSFPSRSLGQYLLGVYNNPNYQKIEASIVSQLVLPRDLDINTGVTDTTSIHRELDTVILRIPYQATLKRGTTSDYTLDSIIGDKSKAFTLNVFETSTFLNALNPNDPTKTNSYQSDATYSKKGATLNFTPDYQFKPNAGDTVFVVNRKLKSGKTFRDEIKLSENNAPFARIPLNKAKFAEFMSKYKNTEFASQDAFNNYFRGIIVEATGNEGSLLSLSIAGQASSSPSIELYYTNTVLSKKTNKVIDTVKVNNSFLLGGIKNSVYKMGATPSVASNQFSLQGTAGNMANIEIFKDGLNDLRSKNWLINDASLTFFVDQTVVKSDTIASPFRLFLFKNPTNSNPAVIKDLLTEGPDSFGGTRQLSADKKPNKYTFRITDYVSDLLNGKANKLPLGLKVFNTSDFPTSAADTIVKTYNWNPKAVMLLDGSISNGARKAQLKISYSIKKN
jgi:hypothetical protein